MEVVSKQANERLVWSRGARAVAKEEGEEGEGRSGREGERYTRGMNTFLLQGRNFQKGGRGEVLAGKFSRGYFFSPSKGGGGRG